MYYIINSFENPMIYTMYDIFRPLAADKLGEVAKIWRHMEIRFTK